MFKGDVVDCEIIFLWLMPAFQTCPWVTFSIFCYGFTLMNRLPFFLCLSKTVFL